MPYWPRCASSTITTTLLRSHSGSSPSVNFCMVVNTMPLASRPTSNSFRFSRLVACTGVWRRKFLQRPNCPNSWSSRSLRSVITAMVGLSRRACKRCAKNTIESDLPEPWVCQNTPILPSPATACPARSMALVTPKYWWYAASIFTMRSPESLKHTKFLMMSSSRALGSMPSTMVFHVAALVSE